MSTTTLLPGRRCILFVGLAYEVTLWWPPRSPDLFQGMVVAILKVRTIRSRNQNDRCRATQDTVEMVDVPLLARLPTYDLQQVSLEAEICYLVV